MRKWITRKSRLYLYLWGISQTLQRTLCFVLIKTTSSSPLFLLSFRNLSLKHWSIMFFHFEFLTHGNMPQRCLFWEHSSTSGAFDLFNFFCSSKTTQLFSNFDPINFFHFFSILSSFPYLSLFFKSTQRYCSIWTHWSVLFTLN